MRLTPAAHVLLGHADALFAQLERLEGDLAAQDAAPRGEVRVGGFPTALAGLLAPAARPLRAAAPAVTLRIQEAETPEAVAMLVARDVDLILGMECSAAPRRDDTRFHREELLGDALDAVAPDRPPARGPRADRPRGAVRRGLGRAAGRLVVRRGVRRRLPQPPGSARGSRTARATGRR